MKINLAFFTSILLIFALLLVGCKNSPEGQENDLENESDSLVIATVIPEYEPVIKEIYAKSLSIEIKTKTILPSIEDLSVHWHDLDVVIKDFLEQNQDVDLIYGFTPEYLKDLVKNGSVKSLNELLDESLIDKLAPVMYDPIIQAGNSKLYAISPTFQSFVLVYNKSIFKEIGIDFPTNTMNWEEVSKLSTDIQEKSDYRGITLGTPPSDKEYYSLFQELYAPMRNFENNSGQTKINTDVNKKYWELFVKLYEDNSKATEEEFVKGEVAMAIFPMNQLTDPQYLSVYGKVDKSNWEIASLPVFEENKGAIIFSDALFSISSHSENKAAIEFLEFVQGKKFAELMVESSLFPTYWDNDIKKQLEEMHGFDFTAAYKQSGALYYKPQFPGPRYNEIQAAGAEYFVQYMNEKNNIDIILNEYENAIN